ncbi:MAG: copper homeostasis protein CutC, partial [Bacteroidota bacterium]|nr:copper homeostasis protein CutC [Bacteroidota bacterium]
MNIFFTECCANSIQSAINGQIAGANRIELCNNLEVGG